MTEDPTDSRRSLRHSLDASAEPAPAGCRPPSRTACRSTDSPEGRWPDMTIALVNDHRARQDTRASTPPALATPTRREGREWGAALLPDRVALASRRGLKRCPATAGLRYGHGGVPGGSRPRRDRGAAGPELAGPGARAARSAVR
jgi:hypothetical protein